jgi:hypothetical protein
LVGRKKIKINEPIEEVEKKGEKKTYIQQYMSELKASWLL